MNRLVNMFLLLSIILMAGCRQDKNLIFQTYSNGLKYHTHLSNPENEKVELFDVVEVYMSYRTTDSVLFSSFPETVAFQVAPVYDGDLMDGLMLMHSGDSTTFAMNTADFYLKMMHFDAIPVHSKNYEELLFDIKIVTIIPETSAIRERRLEFNERQQSEKDRITAYLQSKNYAIEPVENGLFYTQLEEGSGIKPKNGDKVQIHYEASFLDGRPYKSSYGNPAPMSFTIGNGEVIAGLEAGVILTKLGGKAKLIIPSQLAYGRLQRDEIKPFTPLVFEIEILNITSTNF
jgi:FKBP-type peptidyl-prolyl cis-trans isomerase FkpA